MSGFSAFFLCQVILSVAEHHSNLVPWQLVAQKTGAVLKHVRLTQDTQELDMQVRRYTCWQVASWGKRRAECVLDISCVVSIVSGIMMFRLRRDLTGHGIRAHHWCRARSLVAAVASRCWAFVLCCVSSTVRSLLRAWRQSACISGMLESCANDSCQ